MHQRAGVDPMQAARDRGAIGAERAAAHAERIESGWREVALLAIKAYAERTETFQAEDVRLTVPPEADPRAVGALFLEAKRRCWIRPDGYAPSASSNSSPKVRWRSLIVHVPGPSPVNPNP